MGKKMKKLICALLASAMLVSSVGMIAFADADKDENAADTTATETVDTAENTDAAARHHQLRLHRRHPGGHGGGISGRDALHLGRLRLWHPGEVRCPH